jgi:photosystem II stability/assembly factor-like uncharacterized protein
MNFGNNAPFFNDGSPIIAGNVTDLDVDTGSAITIYASISGSGVFKSTDSGTTFPSSGNLFTANNGAPFPPGFIAFAQSTQPNNQIMYVNVALSSPPPNLGMFKSTNKGATWSRIALTTGDTESSPVGYIQTIGVDPKDANRAFIGARALYMVTDRGVSGVTANNRIDLNKVHADQHAFVFSPLSHSPGPAPTRFYNGTDGGIASNPDGGVNNWTLLNGSINCSGPNTALATVLFRQIDIGRGSTANNAYTYGGAQDLGISSHRADCLGTPWILGIGGDGNTVAVDPLDPTHAIGEAGGFTRSTPDGRSWPNVGAGLPAAPSLVYFDPNGAVAYAVVNGTQLYRSLDNGNNFSLMRGFAGAALTAINMVKIDSKTIWVGRGDGTVWHTSTANNGTAAIWNNAPVPGAPSQGVSGIAIDPSNISQVVVVYPSGQAFRTTDNGATWPNITGNLPALPLRAVVVDPNTSPHTIIVANDAGVMRTANLGVTWETLGAGLPHVLCTSLAIDSTAIPSLLRVGTYGRSAFELAYDRQYVDWRNFIGGHNGTREEPFQTVGAAVSAPSNGGTRFINIQAGNYHESLITIPCGTLNALNGPVTIY